MCYLIGLAVPGASDLCFSRATMLRQCSREGAFCGWRFSRKGAPTGSARTPRSTLRDTRVRPWSDALFANIHAFDIRCSRSVVLQPPGRTPAMVARGTRAFCLVWAMPFAPWFVLRIAARRRSLSYALSRGAGFYLPRRCPVAEMDCARGGPRGFCSAMFG